MYSGAVFSYHILQLPIVTRYDSVLKLDADIGFLKDVPFDIGEEIERRKCLVAHTSIIISTTCEAESTPAIHRFTVLHNKSAASINRKWCNGTLMGRTGRVANVFYGNFLAFSTRLILDPDVLALARFLYEKWSRGYYLHRWGDQAPFMLYLCLKAYIPNIKNSSEICNLKSWRHTIFEHGPRQVNKIP